MSRGLRPDHLRIRCLVMPHQRFRAVKVIRAWMSQSIQEGFHMYWLIRDHEGLGYLKLAAASPVQALGRISTDLATREDFFIAADRLWPTAGANRPSSASSHQLDLEQPWDPRMWASELSSRRWRTTWVAEAVTECASLGDGVEACGGGR